MYAVLNLHLYVVSVVGVCGNVAGGYCFKICCESIRGDSFKRQVHLTPTSLYCPALEESQSSLIPALFPRASEIIRRHDVDSDVNRSDMLSMSL